MAVNRRKQKIKKGEYGYLQKNKITQLVISLILMIIVLIIFYTGYIRYGNTKNIFTVFAVVSVIPAAKFLVSYIVMAPHKGVESEEYEGMNQIHHAELLYDLLLSSPEKIFHVKIAAIRDNSVYVYVPDKKYEKIEVEKYIRSFLETECKVTTVKMCRNYNEFKKAATQSDKNDSGTYDARIKELLTIYSM